MKERGLYVRLFHGRKKIEGEEEKLEDWGSDGPIFGPFSWMHTTYINHMKFGGESDSEVELTIIDDLIYYDGVYYGDMSVMLAEEASDFFRDAVLSVYDPEKGIPPERTKNISHGELWARQNAKSKGSQPTPTPIAQLEGSPESKQVENFWTLQVLEGVATKKR